MKDSKTVGKGITPLSPGADGRTRRSFFGLTFISVILALLGGFLYATLRYLMPPRKVQQSTSATGGPVKIIQTAALPEGQSYKFKYGNIPCILINLDGKFLAYGAVCTHLGCIVHWIDEEGCTMSMGDQIHCVCHAGHYSAQTGEVLGGPPPSRLPRLKIVEREGWVYALEWANPGYLRTLATYAFSRA